MTGNVGCADHRPEPRSDCIHCVRAQRDFLYEEVAAVAKCLETPESRLFENHVDPFLHKMRSRGVKNVSDPALRYHLALLVKSLIGAAPTQAPPALERPERARRVVEWASGIDRSGWNNSDLVIVRDGEAYYVVKNRLGTGDREVPITKTRRDELVAQHEAHYARRGAALRLMELDVPEDVADPIPL